MYDIYATDMAFEQCLPNKKHIRIIVPYAVIHYVFSGCGYVSGKRVSAGMMFVASENSYMDYVPDRNDPWSYVYVRLAGEDVKRAFAEAGFANGVSVLPFDAMDVVWHLREVYRALGGEQGRMLAANALFMLHAKKTESTLTVSTRARNAARAKRYIDDNYFKGITVADLAKALYLDEKYMRNLFVDFYGISPKQYLQKKRMTRARELLRETDESISRIAHSVGYDDPLLFSRMFSRYCGISPKQFRAENRP